MNFILFQNQIIKTNKDFTTQMGCGASSIALSWNTAHPAASNFKFEGHKIELVKPGNFIVVSSSAVPKQGCSSVNFRVSYGPKKGSIGIGLITQKNKSQVCVFPTDYEGCVGYLNACEKKVSLFAIDRRPVKQGQYYLAKQGQCISMEIDPTKKKVKFEKEGQEVAVLSLEGQTWEKHNWYVYILMGDETGISVDVL